MADNSGYQTRSRALRDTFTGLFGSPQRVDAELPAQHAPLADPAKDMSDNLIPTKDRADGAHEDESDGPPAQHRDPCERSHHRQGHHDWIPR